MGKSARAGQWDADYKIGFTVAINIPGYGYRLAELITRSGTIFLVKETSLAGSGGKKEEERGRNRAGKEEKEGFFASLRMTNQEKPRERKKAGRGGEGRVPERGC